MFFFKKSNLFLVIIPKKHPILVTICSSLFIEIKPKVLV